MSGKPPCIICELKGNSNGLFTCNGCQQSFCSDHILNHSNELLNRFEQIINEYNLVNEIFHDYKERTNNIQWRIQKLEKETNEIKSQMNKYQKQANYSEKDLDKLMIRLEKIKAQLMQTNQSKSFIERIYSFVWKLHGLFSSTEFRLFFSLLLIILIFYYASSFLQLYSPTKIKFSHVNGPIQLSEDATVAEHNGPDFVSSSFRVHQTYSRGIYSTRLLFKTLSSSNSFIGIIESNANQSISLLYGWFIGDKQMFRIWLSWIHNPLKHYFTCEETQNHTIEMKIDCNKLKIVLNHKEMNEKYELDIDRKQTPLPWQIIIKLDHHGDRVRLQQ
ncbi:unnamed protein product [Rotaria sp. Silwood1]|nr:unnamed protein product [Rotaria sp. Silwood1]CAF4730385.1 unnamed protein product [Rotaria sp. Silwood1]